MATKLTGIFKCNRIPKGAIRTNDNGDKTIWIDIIEKREPDKYGNTHTLTMYDKAEGKAVYLADLKPVQYGSDKNSAPAPKNSAPEGDDDLPF